ncbi:MAG: OmpA/MotB family protein [Chloroflexota bacterium]|jgi:chemotaxis protein MotB
MSPVTGSGRASSRARVQVKVKKDNSERWLLTYSDLITLLLAFFIVMYGMSSADVQKFSQLAASMKRAFNVDVLEGSHSTSILDQSSELPIQIEAGLEDQAGLGATELDIIFSEMGWVFQEEGIEDKVTIQVRQEGVAISLSGNLLFTSGRSDLRPESVRLLSSIAKAIARLPNQVRVEGHTDDIPPNSSFFPTNWELSCARAVAVVRFFTEIEKIDPSRLSAVAYSEYRPVTPNNSPQGRARNRRSEILIMYPPSVMSSSATSTAVAAENINKESNSADTTR